MPPGLDSASFPAALAALGARIRTQTSIILGGAGALILKGKLNRHTDDGDVLKSIPHIGALQADIRAVAEELSLPPGWLNGSIQSYIDILPPDYESRVVTLPPWGKL